MSQLVDATAGSGSRERLAESYWPADTSVPIVEWTVGDLLRAAAAEVPDATALVAGVADPGQRRRWTFAELLGAASASPVGCWSTSSPATAWGSGRRTPRTGRWCSSAARWPVLPWSR